jgi:hypothetical protein
MPGLFALLLHAATAGMGRVVATPRRGVLSRCFSHTVAGSSLIVWQFCYAESAEQVDAYRPYARCHSATCASTARLVAAPFGGYLVLKAGCATACVVH